jgi:hypothetical protein
MSRPLRLSTTVYGIAFGGNKNGNKNGVWIGGKGEKRWQQFMVADFLRVRTPRRCLAQ